jgi:hypothetical protein
MDTTTITITLDRQTATTYYAASPEDQQKMQLLFRLLLREYTETATRQLREVMDAIGANAHQRGLTPDILEHLLHDDAETPGH